MLTLVFSTWLVAQQFVPGQSIHATCDGQWTNVTQSTADIDGDCVALPPPPDTGIGIVIDHAAVTDEAFAAVPMAAVQALRIMSVDKSVGWNITLGLKSCLQVESIDSIAACQRWAWPDGSYSVEPAAWSAHPLPSYQYFTWPGQTPPDGTPNLPCSDTSSMTACFESYLDAHASEWDVVSMQPTYLEAGTYQLTVEDYLASYERIRTRHPELTVILHTSNLSRTYGSDRLAPFNEAVRRYVAENGGVLIDIADIETFDPYGAPWFYDGFPVISPYYTTEINGGHLGSPSIGMIRLAQAFWIGYGHVAALR